MRRLGIVTGMAAEAACFTSVPKERQALLFCAGGNSGRAQAGAADLIRQGATALISCGIAGGLDPALGTGEIVIGDTVLSSAGELRMADERWVSHIETLLSARRGRVMTLDQAAATPAAKRRLHERCGAAVVDMESSGVATAAVGAGLPFLAIRIVADTADMHLPRSALVGLAPDGSTRPAAVMAALLSRPWELPALLTLARATGHALETLRGVAALDLGFPADRLGRHI